MKTLRHIHGGRQSGVAAIEFALILPLLIFLAFPIIDFARAIQANMILINISREGANLASRASLQYSPQDIMDDLAATAPPLNLGGQGMIYITKVMGNNENCDKNGKNCTVRNIVLEQDRWQQGWSQSGYGPASSVWNCGTWGNDGSCSGLPSAGTSSPTASVMAGQLADGQIVYAVEAFYRFNMFFSGMSLGPNLTMPTIGPTLYSMTIF